MIRVSVVATGVDIANVAARPAGHAPIQAPPSAQARPPAPAAAPPGRANVSAEAKSAEFHESRIAELAQRLKADNARIVERTEMTAPRRLHRLVPQRAGGRCRLRRAPP